jgi:gluconokinase
MNEPTQVQVPALVVMGVSGSGKTTLAQALARDMSLDFVEGDDLHSPANIAKMRRGEPLDDDDRTPWLAAIGQRLADSKRYPHGVVISCSALKLVYRRALRVDPRVRFIFLDANRDQIEQRLARRPGHFMPRTLMASQFDTLERPLPTESDVLTVPAALPLDELERRVEGFLEGR